MNGYVAGWSSGVTGVSAGGYFTCAIAAGGAECGGKNAYGQLGNGTINDSTSPVGVVAMSSAVTSIDAGSYHACAVVNGAARCWGNNVSGALGNGASGPGEYENRPVEVVGLGADVAQVSAGTHFSCALTARGRVLCWGANVEGQLGDGTNTDRTLPEEVAGF